MGDIRPDDHRHRIDTPTLRGVNIQRLFGSQRALKTVEDFTEFFEELKIDLANLKLVIEKTYAALKIESRDSYPGWYGLAADKTIFITLEHRLALLKENDPNA